MTWMGWLGTLIFPGWGESTPVFLLNPLHRIPKEIIPILIIIPNITPKVFLRGKGFVTEHLRGTPLRVRIKSEGKER